MQALKKLLAKILPSRVKSAIKYVLRTPLRLSVQKKRVQGKVVERDDIVRGLQKLGIKKGETIFVHSSFSSFGFVKNGPMEVIEALLAVVGPTGNVCMPSFGPLADGKTFDVRKTPSGVGKLPAVFWRLPNAKRSLSPTHSVACIGKDADYITKGHLLDDTPFSRNSPYCKMMQLGGKVVALGSPFRRSLTCNYIFEDLVGSKFPIKVYEERPREFVVVDAEGKKRVVKKKAHSLAIDSQRIDYNPGLADWFEGILLKRECMRKGRIGQAEVRIYGIRCLVDTLGWLLKQGKTIYRERNVENKN